MPRNGIAGSYSSSTFSFLRNLHTLLCSVYTIYIPTNNEGVFPFFHTLSGIYYLQTFLMMAVLTNVRSYLIVV